MCLCTDGPVQFLKCISFFSLDRIIYWNKLYDLRSLVGLPVWFYWTKYSFPLFSEKMISAFLLRFKANYLENLRDQVLEKLLKL